MGMDPEVLKDVPELSDLLQLGRPNFRHLSKVILQLQTEAATPAAQAFLAAARALDEALFAWRKLHMGVAKRYLADVTGSGGTPGFSYLKAHYAHKVFSREPILASQEEWATNGTHGAVHPMLGPAN
jgi:hypothetical protein